MSRITPESHLKSVHPAFGKLIENHGPCPLKPDPNPFRILVRSIISQLISTAAARSISGRLDDKLKGKITPGNLLKLTDDELQTCGISGSKRKTLRGLAEHFRNNRAFGRKLERGTDDEVREMLIPLHGIGPWTVHMVLMFGLGRPDVLPVGDLGLRAGVRDLFGFPELPTAGELTTLAEP